MRTFKFTAPLENLVLSWVRRVVGDDSVEILRVVFRQHMQSLKFSLPLPRENKNKKNVLNFCTSFHTFSKSMSRMQRMSLVLWIARKKG